MVKNKIKIKQMTATVLKTKWKHATGIPVNSEDNHDKVMQLKVSSNIEIYFKHSVKVLQTRLDLRDGRRSRP